MHGGSYCSTEQTIKVLEKVGAIGAEFPDHETAKNQPEPGMLSDAYLARLNYD